MTASPHSAALWHLRGVVVHRSGCWLDLVVSVWLDWLTRLGVDEGCRIERRLIRLLELPGSGSFPGQTGRGVLMRQMRYGSVAGTLAWRPLA